MRQHLPTIRAYGPNMNGRGHLQTYEYFDTERQQINTGWYDPNAPRKGTIGQRALGSDLYHQQSSMGVKTQNLTTATGGYMSGQQASGYHSHHFAGASRCIDRRQSQIFHNQSTARGGLDGGQITPDLDLQYAQTNQIHYLNGQQSRVFHNSQPMGEFMHDFEDQGYYLHQSPNNVIPNNVYAAMARQSQQPSNMTIDPQYQSVESQLQQPRPPWGF
jgi:hypothetical protein